MKNTRMGIDPNAHYTVIDDTAIVLDGRRGKYLGLNETATRIFALLSQGHSVDRVVRTMADDYDVDPSALEQDVDRFIGEMEALGLLVPDPSAGRGRS